MGVFFLFFPILPDEMDDLVSRHPLSFAVVIFILFCPHIIFVFDASLLRHRRLEKIMVLVFVAHQRAARKKKKKTKTTKEEEDKDER